MGKDKVYVSKDGHIGLAKGTMPKDALLFTTSKRSLKDINRAKRARLRRGNDFLLERIDAANQK